MMNKFLKSTAILTAVAVIAMAGLTGCGSKKGSDGAKGQTSSTVAAETKKETLPPATIKWLLRIPAQKEGATVLAEINKVLKEKINATLDIQFIEAAAYPEKTKLMITAGEEFDIMFTAVGYGYFDYVTKGAYIPLDELLTKYAKKTYEQIPAGFWNATKINGKIYGIPNYQIAARQSVISMRKDTADKYGINMNDIKKLEQLEPALAKLKAGEPSDTFIFTPPGLTYFDTMNYMGLETLGAEGTPGSIEIDGKDYKVFNQYEHPSFVSMVKLMKSWAEKGYVNKDFSLVKDATELNKNGKILSGGFSTYKPGVEAEGKARYGYESVLSKMTEPYVNTTSILGTLQAISKTSKNPERAMMFLDIVNTDKQVYNTLLYGIENKNYKKTEANRVELIPDSGYSTNVAWMLGNTMNAYLLPGVQADVYEQTDKLNKSSKVSRIMGFNFNPEPVKAEIAQCLTVKDKYIVSLQYGMADVDKTLAAFNSELKAAGMDKVIAEKQKQLDAWAATNKK